MDPDAALAELRKLVTDLDLTTFCDLAGIEPVVDRVVELFQGLDDWLVRGGATPRAWARLYLGLGGQLDPPAPRPKPFAGPGMYGDGDNPYGPGR